MKKRLWSLLLALSLLFLASCGHKEAAGDGTAATEPPQTEQTEATEQMEQSEAMEQTESTEQSTEPTEAPEQTGQTEVAGPAPVPDYSSAEELRRPEHAWLYYDSDPLCDKEGGVSIEDQVHEKADATLYIGDSYSIYILMDEWVYQSDTMGGFPADIWTNTLDGEEAELRIVKMDSKDYPEAQAWVREQYPDYTFTEDKRSGLCGLDLPFPNTTLFIDVSFCSLSEDLYAVIQTQPAEVKKHNERFMCQLRAMIDTFQPFFYFPTAGELGRSEHTQLSGGADTRSEASLYVGNSYSIYLPDEGWIPQTDTAELQTVGAWKSTVYEGVELRIDRRRNWNPEYEEVLVKLLDPEYTLIEKGEYGVIGENAKGWRMEAGYQLDEFSPKYDKHYYIMYKVYPAVDTEESARAMSLLDAVADTFEPYQNAAGYYRPDS